MAVNKQPVFTGTPILKCNIFDPNINTDSTNPAGWSPIVVYTCNSTEGDLIERITISATGDTTNTTVNDKLVYIYLYENGVGYSLYDTIHIPATTISSTTPNPVVQLVFTGGILFNTDDKIYIGASTNASTTGQNGDKLSVTVEGGSYTQP